MHMLGPPYEQHERTLDHGEHILEVCGDRRLEGCVVRMRVRNISNVVTGVKFSQANVATRHDI